MSEYPRRTRQDHTLAKRLAGAALVTGALAPMASADQASGNVPHNNQISSPGFEHLNDSVRNNELSGKADTISQQIINEVTKHQGEPGVQFHPETEGRGLLSYKVKKSGEQPNSTASYYFSVEVQKDAQGGYTVNKRNPHVSAIAIEEGTDRQGNPTYHQVNAEYFQVEDSPWVANWSDRTRVGGPNGGGMQGEGGGAGLRPLVDLPLDEIKKIENNTQAAFAKTMQDAGFSS